ncbi:DUF4374 domain-containing protein [Pontibacter toksunensis]|uniref:DUF4374 domain-containing protein n=1 Tax=Pontibacter toksunensis TaxID=1332631 RepID=A0ABW6C2L2_9BACT
MFSIKLARQLALPVMSLCATVLFTSCDSSDDSPAPVVEENPFVVSLAIKGSDGGFTYYTVPFEDVMSGALSAEGQGIEQPGYYDFTQIDNTIYSIGGLSDVNVVSISQNAAGELTQIGNVSFANPLSDIVKADDNTLVALEMAPNSDMVKFHTIDANTVKVTSTKQHPVSDITELSAPAYSGMRISGNHLFLSYYISDPNTFATPYTDAAQIAVYSYPGLEFQKVIEDTRTGPVGGFNIKSGLIKDGKGDIYALSHSNPANGYSQTTKEGGILRIKSGETAFDQDYFFDIEEINGGKNIAHLKYLGNGKAFAEINTADNDQQERWTDGPLRSAVIDLYNKTVTYIDGIPEHAGNGRRLAALHHENFVYLPVPEGNSIYVYKIDVENHTATKGAEVEANFVAGLFKL